MTEAQQDGSETDGADTDTEGIEVLAAANYQTFEEVCQVVTEDTGIEYRRMRNALGHWVDTDLDAAAEEYELPVGLLERARDDCYARAEELYPEFLA